MTRAAELAAASTAKIDPILSLCAAVTEMRRTQLATDKRLDDVIDAVADTYTEFGTGLAKATTQVQGLLARQARARQNLLMVPAAPTTAPPETDRIRKLVNADLM